MAETLDNTINSASLWDRIKSTSNPLTDDIRSDRGKIIRSWFAKGRTPSGHGLVTLHATLVEPATATQGRHRPENVPYVSMQMEEHFKDDSGRTKITHVVNLAGNTTVEHQVEFDDRGHDWRAVDTLSAAAALDRTQLTMARTQWDH